MTLDDLGERLFATVNETAAITRYDPRTVRRAIERGEMPGIKVGVTWRVPVAWLREQAAAHAPAT
jgi:excisionase family DNA binding protein